MRNGLWPVVMVWHPWPDEQPKKRKTNATDKNQKVEN